MDKGLPSRAQIVIIGGGIVGCSVAYHLAKLGLRDVVLLEQGRLSCGTTWHAAGLVGQLRSSENMTRLIRYSTELYERLEAETGFGTGWKRTGSISVASTPSPGGWTVSPSPSSSSSWTRTGTSSRSSWRTRSSAYRSSIAPA